MAHTNRARVILGGLIAGLVINIVEYITNGVILREAWGQAMQALGKSGAFTMGGIYFSTSGDSCWASLLSGSMRPSEHATAQDRIPQSALDWSHGELRCFSLISAIIP